MPDVVSPARVAASLTELWSPRVVAEIDDSYVKVAKVHGTLTWHSHDDEDELFYILKGTLAIEMADRTVVLHEGESFVVPKGVRHRTRAPQRTVMLMVEGEEIVPTGDPP